MVTMVRPRCLCKTEMTFLMDNMVHRIWQCPQCKTLLHESKVEGQNLPGLATDRTWHVAVARLATGWSLTIK